MQYFLIIRRIRLCLRQIIHLALQQSHRLVETVQNQQQQEQQQLNKNDFFCSREFINPDTRTPLQIITDVYGLTCLLEAPLQDPSPLGQDWFQENGNRYWDVQNSYTKKFYKKYTYTASLLRSCDSYKDDSFYCLCPLCVPMQNKNQSLKDSILRFLRYSQSDESLESLEILKRIQKNMRMIQKCNKNSLTPDTSLTAAERLAAQSAVEIDIRTAAAMDAALTSEASTEDAKETVETVGTAEAEKESTAVGVNGEKKSYHHSDGYISFAGDFEPIEGENLSFATEEDEGSNSNSSSCSRSFYTVPRLWCALKRTGRQRRPVLDMREALAPIELATRSTNNRRIPIISYRHRHQHQPQQKQQKHKESDTRSCEFNQSLTGKLEQEPIAVDAFLRNKSKRDYESEGFNSAVKNNNNGNNYKESNNPYDDVYNSRGKRAAEEHGRKY